MARPECRQGREISPSPRSHCGSYRCDRGPGHPGPSHWLQRKPLRTGVATPIRAPRLIPNRIHGAPTQCGPQHRPGCWDHLENPEPGWGESQVAVSALAHTRAPPTSNAPAPPPAPPSAPGPFAPQLAARRPGAARTAPQTRLPLLLARVAAQVHASDARLLRTAARAAPPAVVRLARLLRRRLARGARAPRVGGTCLRPTRYPAGSPAPHRRAVDAGAAPPTGTNRPRTGID